MSARVKRGHGEFVFVGKGATDYRALARFRAGELVSINMSSNRLTTMLGLAQHASLVSLDLSHNLVETTDGLEGLAMLQVLRLHHNHLTSVNGLEQLQQLQVLDLNNNDLTSIAELRRCTGLTELDVSCNALSELDDISSLNRLATLSLRGNLLKLLDYLPACLPASLRKLDLAQNSIGEVSELQNLRSLHSLEHVDVSDNVFAATALHNGFSYRPLTVAFVPALQTLDGEPVTREERRCADQLFNGDARRNLALLEVGQEAGLLRFLMDQCPANHGAAPTTVARLARPTLPVSDVGPLPTAAQFAKLEEQVKEMRRYFKQYVKTEARKRERAARVLQACVLGRIVRKQLAGHLRPSKMRTQGNGDGARQIQIPPPMQANRGGAEGWRATAHGEPRRPVSQSFNPDRYQLVQPSRPAHRSSIHGGRSGGGEDHRAAQLIQARQRGILARRRLADYQNCKDGAVRIQVNLRLCFGLCYIDLVVIAPSFSACCVRARQHIVGWPSANGWGLLHDRCIATAVGTAGLNRQGPALAEVRIELLDLQGWSM